MNAQAIVAIGVFVLGWIGALLWSTATNKAQASAMREATEELKKAVSTLMEFRIATEKRLARLEERSRLSRLRQEQEDDGA